MATPAVAAGSIPVSVAVDSTGKYAYVVNNLGNTVSQYSIGADGALSPMATATVATGASPAFVTTVGTYQ